MYCACDQELFVLLDVVEGVGMVRVVLRLQQGVDVVVVLSWVCAMCFVVFAYVICYGVCTLSH